MADDDERLKKAIEQALLNATQPDAARRALALLFPKAAAASEAAVPSGAPSSQERSRSRRISMADFATAYFRLDPQKATWGRSEIEETLSSPHPLEALKVVEERLSAAAEDDRPRLRRLFLTSLDGAFGPTRPFTAEWLRAIVDVSPMYIAAIDESRSSIFRVDNSQRLLTVVMRALEQLSPPDRARVILEIVPEVHDLSLLSELVRGLAGDRHPDGARDDRRSGLGESVDGVREALLVRVRQIAQNGEIWSQADPAKILWFWWGCDLEAEVRAFIDRAMADRDVQRSLMEITINRVYSTAGDYDRVRRSTWSKIVNLDDLQKHAREFTSENASDEDRRIGQRFLDALAKWDAEPD
jgi:hypothetical protein